MMAPAATALGFELRVLAEGEDVSAVSAVANAPVGDYKDLEHLLEFSRGLDVLTFDHEHVPTAHLRSLIGAGVNVHPGPDALVNAQDKLVMRAAIDRLELPNPTWAAVANVADLVAFGEETGWPVVLKMPRGGYDGKGVRIVSSAEDAAAPPTGSRPCPPCWPKPRWNSAASSRPWSQGRRTVNHGPGRWCTPSRWTGCAMK